ncbi:phosphotransferase [Jannaschia aquimarina]|uniref:Phosphotransferase enzyme family protein n=1 Tax=Jannaschia aquimarina TaxID=935700 RepID=A0A0D1D398_9RHOB|nr:phosphotransferase [Jannaschia aquimarina]KIT14593.1 Phosphotransferase enzyme family protein [Jannaschia aquimarina]SNS77012.1 Phosphotransferase enzyme family protein [Jannaschia aquimarina]
MANTSTGGSDRPDLPDLARGAIKTWNRVQKLTLRPQARAEDWSLLALRGAGAGRRVVLRLRRNVGPDLAVKMRPALGLRAYAEQVIAHRRFARLLDRSSCARAPALAGFHPLARLIAVEFVEGDLALDRVVASRHSPDRGLTVLADACRWVEGVGRVVPSRTRQWDGRLGRLRLKEVRERAPDLAGDAMPARLLGALERQLERRTGTRVEVRLVHGDFHLRNLIFGQDKTVWGLDFDRLRKAPQEYDLARVVTHFLLLAGPVEESEMQGWLERDMSRVLSASGLETDRGLLDLFMGMDTIVLWGDLARQGDRAGPGAKHRYARARALAQVMVNRLS